MLSPSLEWNARTSLHRTRSVSANCARVVWTVVLISTLLLGLPAVAQTPAPQTPAPQTPAPAPGLQVIVVEGNSAINNIGQHRAKEPVVRVVDQSGAPVKDASVTFLLPDTGPSGLFGASGRTLTVLTDETGQATGRGLVPNQVSGKFEMRVVASQGGQTAKAVITQTNAEPIVSTKGSSKKLLLLVLIGGAAAGGVAAAMGHGGSSTSSPSPPPPVSSSGAIIVPGAPVFQPPH